MFALYPSHRFTQPGEMVEIDHENRMIMQQFAKVLDEVDDDPARFLKAAMDWLSSEGGAFAQARRSFVPQWLAA
jgi:hypothetical protein